MTFRPAPSAHSIWTRAPVLIVPDLKAVVTTPSPLRAIWEWWEGEGVWRLGWVFGGYLDKWIFVQVEMPRWLMHAQVEMRWQWWRW